MTRPPSDRADGIQAGATAQLLRELESIRGTLSELADRRAEERREEERVLRSLAEGTAGATGERFFRSLVRHLAAALGLQHVFVAEFTERKSRVRTLAYWVHDDWVPNIEFDLEGTPCEDVVRGDLCHHPDRVAELFPKDVPLAQAGLRSYLGVPLVAADGEVLGHLAVMGTEPMAAEPRGLSIFRIFANRARAELERIRFERGLEQARAELESKVTIRTAELERRERDLRVLLAINRAISSHLDRERLLASLVSALRPAVPIDRAGVFLPQPDGSHVRIYALHAEDRTALEIGDVIEREGSAAGWVLGSGNPYVGTSLEAVRARFPETAEAMAREGMASLCALPLRVESGCIGTLFLFSARPGAYDEAALAFLMEMAGALAAALDNCLAYEEIKRLRDRLQADNVYLKEEIQGHHDFTEILGSSPALLEALRKVEIVAPTDSTVLLLGETGTGKELLARAIHDRSTRRDRPLVTMNCAAIAAGLVESELFGHIKGAFTGAVDPRVGRFQLADGGTLFLDEVGELPLDTQSKLLRVLQEGELEPVGSSRTLKVDVRIIAATNRDLAQEVRAGRMRSDLYYRLNVVPIRTPPLRERRADIPLLVHYFAERYARRAARPITGVSATSMELLERYDWPGNVRELQNVIERAVLLAEGSVLEVSESMFMVAPSAPHARPDPTSELEWEPSPDAGRPAPFEPLSAGDRQTDAPTAAADSTAAPFPTLEEFQRSHIIDALERCAGVIDGAAGAARMLGMHPNTLRSRMQKLGVGKVRRADGDAADRVS